MLTPVNVGQAIATDASGIQTLGHNAPKEFTLGINTVIWTAIDGAGNMAIATQTITISDTIPPTISSPDDIVIEAENPTQNKIVLEQPIVSDTIGVMSISSDAPESYPIGETVITWTATDIVGNSATAVQKVKVIDTASPTLHVPGDLIIEASSVDKNDVYLGEPTVIDNGKIASITNDSPVFFSLGNTTVTWIASDESGNTATDQQLVSVIDTTQPEITPPEDITIEATSIDSNEIDIGLPMVSDVQDTTITSDSPQVFSIGKTIVTWSAQDPFGNSANATQIVTIVDTTSPSIVVPEDVVVEATSLENNIVNLGEITVEDVSGIDSITNDSPESFALGETVVTWTAQDNYGNVATARQTISVIDSTPPSVVAPDDIDAEAVNMNENYFDIGFPTVSDLVEIESITSDAPEAFAIGVTIVTWTVIDTSGNLASEIQTIIVSDTTQPEIESAQEIVIEATAPEGMSIALEDVEASDLIGIDTITNNSPEIFPIGTTIVTWNVADLHGNSAKINQTVTIADTTPPTITAPDNLIVEATNPTSSVVSIGKALANDLVGVVSLTNDSPEFFSLGDTVVTWTATDQAGNLATSEHTIKIIDTTPPSIHLLDTLILEATSNNNNTIDLPIAAAEDLVGVHSITNDAPKAFPVGDTVVTWIANDTSGNVAESSQVVSIIDTTSPKLYAPSAKSIEATSEIENYVDFGIATASDEVGVTSILNDAPESFPLGLTTINWTASDEAGNTYSALQQIQVVDTTAPKLIPPNDLQVEATSLNANVVSIGNPNVTDAVSVQSVTHDAPEVFALGETIITWTAIDLSGNSANATQKILVSDTTAPQIEPPNNITFEATSQSNNVIALGEPNARETVTSSTITNDAPGSFSLGDTIVTWTATDENGNSASATQTVSIVDTTSPVIIVPDDVIVEATTFDQNEVFLGNTSSTDNGKIASITNDAPAFFTLGDTIVTWIATDESGNSASDTQLVSIVDTTAPRITAPYDITFEATSQSNNVIALGEPNARETVTSSTITNDAPGSFSLGDTIVTWTATDENGNSASATQTVSIVDTTSPVLVVPDDVIVEATSPDENVIDIGVATADDNVVIESITNDAPDVFSYGNTTVTWIAQDSSGNFVNATQSIVVIDTMPPIITSPEDVKAEATGINGNVIEIGMAIADDLVEVASLTNNAPGSFSLGDTIVTWTATDENGNSASATQTVSIVDTTSPVIIVPDDVIVEATTFDQNEVFLGNTSSTDNGKIASITNDAPAFFTLGDTIVTWIATDESGNSASDTQLVSIVDTTAPRITAPYDITFEATSQSNNVIALGEPNARETVTSSTITNDAPGSFSLGDTIVTWTATDENGNSASATQTVSIVDTTSPVLVVPDDVIVEATSLETQVNIGVSNVTDLTDDSPILSNDAPMFFALGETIVTWSASDIFGNFVESSQTITVQACGKPISYYNLIKGSNDDDSIMGTNQPDLIFALGGDDTIMGYKGNDCIFGGEGEDIVFGNEGNDSVMGDQGNDILKGNSGDDVILGGAGLDIIDGGDDADSCNVFGDLDGDLIIKCE